MRGLVLYMMCTVKGEDQIGPDLVFGRVIGLLEIKEDRSSFWNVFLGEGFCEEDFRKGIIWNR